MSISAYLRRSVFVSVAFLFTVFACLSSAKAIAAELVMFESEGCEWCEIWNEEVGVAYTKTTEAEIVPLRRVDIDDDLPVDLKHLNGLVYTPTFVVMRGGQEVGRIIGYPGEDFFWQLLNEIMVNKGLLEPSGS